MNTRFGGSRVRLLSCQSGAAAVEFALVFPLLVVFLMGIIDFGRAWHRNQVITDAAREGARWAVVKDGATKAETVTQIVQDRLALSNLDWDGTVTGYAASCKDWVAPGGSSEQLVVAGCGWGDETGEEARVVISAPYPFSFIGPVLKLIAGEGKVDAVVLSTNFVMRNE